MNGPWAVDRGPWAVGIDALAVAQAALGWEREVGIQDGNGGRCFEMARCRQDVARDRAGSILESCVILIYYIHL